MNNYYFIKFWEIYRFPNLIFKNPEDLKEFLFKNYDCINAIIHDECKYHSAMSFDIYSTTYGSSLSLFYFPNKDKLIQFMLTYSDFIITIKGLRVDEKNIKTSFDFQKHNYTFKQYMKIKFNANLIKNNIGLYKTYYEFENEYNLFNFFNEHKYSVKDVI